MDHSHSIAHLLWSYPCSVAHLSLSVLFSHPSASPEDRSVTLRLGTGMELEALGFRVWSLQRRRKGFLSITGITTGKYLWVGKITESLLLPVSAA